MNENLRRPPRLAAWLLRRLCSKSYGESLGGDLLERFQEGQSNAWFQRQVAVAIVLSAWDEVRPRPFHLAFAAAGTVVIMLSGSPIIDRLGINLAFVWLIRFRWPWSTVLDIGLGASWHAALMLPVVAAFIFFGRRSARRFTWVGALQTVLITIPMFAASELAYVAFWDWHLNGSIVLNRLGVGLTMFVPLLVASCLGFRSGRRREVSGTRLN